MGSILKMTVLLAVLAGTSASDADSVCPIYYEGQLQCSGKGLSAPPSGNWSGIRFLFLWNNTISKLPKGSFSGFAAVASLDLSLNSLTEIDFEVLATMVNLSYLAISYNQIDTLKPPPEGTILDKLQTIHATENRISQLDPNLFLFAPNLTMLNIDENPLLVEPGKPALNHPKLQELSISFGSTSFDAVDSTLLSALPNLRRIFIYGPNVTRVEGAFINNKFLELIDLSYNAITQITPGTFSSEGLIRRLNLRRNPLTRLDIAAVDEAMASSGRIDISDTTLACECGPALEALLRWAATKHVWIVASCEKQPGCSLTWRLYPWK